MMLNKKKIETLGPGREIDLLIAEHVFGWTEEMLRQVQVPSSLEEALEWGWEEYTDETYDWRRSFRFGTVEAPISLHTPHGWDFYALPKWSVNIFLAWNVLQTLPLPRSVHERDPKGVAEGKTFMCNVGLKKKWRDRVNRYGDTIPESYIIEYHGFADTAPLAICRVALIYKMEK